LTIQDSKRQGRPKSEEKRNLILQSASCLFLQEGFANTSMDNVAKASGVSKQTVYSHFENKDSLFQAVIRSKCHSYQIDTTQIQPVIDEQLSLTQYLKKLASNLICLLQDPDAIAVFRVIIAEASNSPHMAKLFYDAGPGASLNKLGHAFYLYGENKLSHALSQQLAYDFYALLKGEFHIKLLCGIESAMTDEKMAQHVEAVVYKTTILFDAYCNTLDPQCVHDS